MNADHSKKNPCFIVAYAVILLFLLSCIHSVLTGSEKDALNPSSIKKRFLLKDYQ